jgi:hypothetical protein
MKTSTLKKIILVKVVAICAMFLVGLGYALLELEQKSDNMVTLTAIDLTVTPNNESTIIRPGETPSKSPALPSSQQLFDLDQKNQVLPDVILEEIAWFGFGLGGEICSDDIEGLSFVLESSTQNWLTEQSIFTCGWQPGELVQITVVDENDNVIYASDGAATAHFWPGLNSRPGKLKITVQGESGTLSRDVEIIMPVGPRFYRILSQPHLVLYNFASYEKIWIVAYELHQDGSATPAGWEQYQADENGQLVIAGTHDEHHVVYVAIGEKSGTFVESVQFASPIVLDMDGSRTKFIEPIP